MAEPVDYFSNHRFKRRFPWRLYHAPITRALERAVLGAPGPDLLNIGSGPIVEPEHLVGPPRRYTICDIDPRAIEQAAQRYGARLAGADVIAAGAPLPYRDASFDLVLSTDVIEHVSEPLAWIREALRVLRPGGHLFLTTPNYGSASLRLIESTVLELVAKLQGFTRRGLHPSKFDARRLREMLATAGARPQLETLAFGWVLAARAKKGDGAAGTSR